MVIIIVIVLAHLVETLTHKIQLEFPSSVSVSGRMIGADEEESSVIDISLPFIRPPIGCFQLDTMFL